jgi:hypothetical protein
MHVPVMVFQRPLTVKKQHIWSDSCIDYLTWEKRLKKFLGPQVHLWSPVPFLQTAGLLSI